LWVMPPIVVNDDCAIVRSMKEVRVRWFVLLVFASGILCAHSQPREIVILRHAEEPQRDSIHLSAKGQKRAQALADFFRTNALVTQFGTPVAVFAASPTPSGSGRSVETLIPTSEALGLSIRQPFTKEQHRSLAQKILRMRS